MKPRVLVIMNIITLVLLGWVLLRNKIRDRPVVASIDHRSTAFREQTELHALYPASGIRVIMLGTSYTARAQWQELLGRCDAVGRGINGDLSSGLLARTEDVIRIHPQVCFIECGLNDLESGIPGDSVLLRITAMAGRMQAAGITPVLTALFPLGKPYPDVENRNKAIAALNSSLHSLAKARGYAIIDINRRIAPDGLLRPENSQPDGCHLRAPAYALWRDAVKDILAKTRL